MQVKISKTKTQISNKFKIGKTQKSKIEILNLICFLQFDLWCFSSYFNIKFFWYYSLSVFQRNIFFIFG